MQNTKGNERCHVHANEDTNMENFHGLLNDKVPMPIPQGCICIKRMYRYILNGILTITGNCGYSLNAVSTLNKDGGSAISKKIEMAGKCSKGILNCITEKV
jgi:hypothetical protein